MWKTWDEKSHKFLDLSLESFFFQEALADLYFIKKGTEFPTEAHTHFQQVRSIEMPMHFLYILSYENMVSFIETFYENTS